MRYDAVGTQLGCYDTCLPGTFYETKGLDPVLAVSITNPVNPRCAACDANCLTCEIRADKCTSCLGAPDNFIFNDKCTTTCNSGQFINRDDPIKYTCSFCHSTCLTCTERNNYNCESCVGGRYLFENRCYLECRPRNYFNYGTNTCDPCDLSCQECIHTRTNCARCADNELIEDQQTQVIIPGPLVPIDSVYSPRAILNWNTKCIPNCDDTCDVCMKSLECTTCKEGLSQSMRDRTKCFIVPVSYLSVVNTEIKLGTRTDSKKVHITFTFN